MDIYLYPNISLWPHIDYFLKKLCIESNESEIKNLKGLIREIEDLARPKAVYRPEYIETRGSDIIIVNKLQLKSQILQDNTKEANRVYPFIATCGKELYYWLQNKRDDLVQYYAQTILEKLLQEVILSLGSDIQDRFAISQISQMQPGSLPDWPIEEQANIFRILENGAEEIGVELTSSLLMLPKQSLSGIFFYTPKPFVSCQLCTIKDCPNRQTI